MRKFATLASVLLISGAVNAELNVNFEDVTETDDLEGIQKISKSVTIAENDGEKVLRVGNPKGIIKMKTGTKEKEFSFSVDWLCTSKRPTGGVFRLSDYNHNKKFISFTAEGGKVNGSTFRNGKMKKRRIFKPEAKTWYRFELDVKGEKYTVKVLNRDTKEVVYDSVEKRKTLRTNSGVTPNILMFSQWGKNAGPTFDYNNIVLSD